jgi:hypothetical protein
MLAAVEVEAPLHIVTLANPHMFPLCGLLFFRDDEDNNPLR